METQHTLDSEAFQNAINFALADAHNVLVVHSAAYTVVKSNVKAS